MTDHKKESEQLVEQSKKSTADPTIWLLGAQAHATLALVEQQRIANLIALKDSINTFQREGYALDTETQGWLDKATEQAIEGLGL